MKNISNTSVLFCGWDWCDVSMMQASSVPHYWFPMYVDDASVKIQEDTLFDRYSLQWYNIIIFTICPLKL